MSETMRNRPGGDQGNYNRMSEDNQENMHRYEGFEGMNFEQIRQPYNPQHKDRKRGNSESPGDSDYEKS